MHIAILALVFGAFVCTGLGAFYVFRNSMATGINTVSSFFNKLFSSNGEHASSTEKEFKAGVDFQTDLLTRDNKKDTDNLLEDTNSQYQSTYGTVSTMTSEVREYTGQLVKNAADIDEDNRITSAKIDKQEREISAGKLNSRSQPIPVPEASKAPDTTKTASAQTRKIKIDSAYKADQKHQAVQEEAHKVLRLIG